MWFPCKWEGCGKQFQSKKLLNSHIMGHMVENDATLEEEINDIPDIPDIPDMPDMADMPDIPDMPDMPTLEDAVTGALNVPIHEPNQMNLDYFVSSVFECMMSEGLALTSGEETDLQAAGSCAQTAVPAPKCTDDQPVVEHCDSTTLTPLFICDVQGCNKQVPTKIGLKRHSIIVHANDNKDQITEVSPPEESSLERVETKRFVCRVEGCGKVLRSNRSFEIHAVTHSKDNQDHPIATIPEKTISQKAVTKRYVCEVEGCGKVLRSNKSFEIHAVTHAKDNQDHPIVTIPEKTISQNAVTKRYVCEVEGCGKVLKSNKALENHAVTHVEDNQDHPVVTVPEETISQTAGTKRYVCEVGGCGKELSRNDSLENHMAMHSDNPEAKPYCCEVPDCSARFVQPFGLKRHLTRVHGEGVDGGEQDGASREPSEDVSNKDDIAIGKVAANGEIVAEPTGTPVSLAISFTSSLPSSKTMLAAAPLFTSTPFTSNDTGLANENKSKLERDSSEAKYNNEPTTSVVPSVEAPVHKADGETVNITVKKSVIKHVGKKTLPETVTAGTLFISKPVGLMDWRMPERLSNNVETKTINVPEEGVDRPSTPGPTPVSERLQGTKLSRPKLKRNVLVGITAQSDLMRMKVNPSVLSPVVHTDTVIADFVTPISEQLNVDPKTVIVQEKSVKLMKKGMQAKGVENPFLEPLNIEKMELVPSKSIKVNERGVNDIELPILEPLKVEKIRLGPSESVKLKEMGVKLLKKVEEANSILPILEPLKIVKIEPGTSESIKVKKSVKLLKKGKEAEVILPILEPLNIEKIQPGLSESVVHSAKSSKGKMGKQVGKSTKSGETTKQPTPSLLVENVLKLKKGRPKKVRPLDVGSNAMNSLRGGDDRSSLVACENTVTVPIQNATNPELIPGTVISDLVQAVNVPPAKKRGRPRKTIFVANNNLSEAERKVFGVLAGDRDQAPLIDATRPALADGVKCEPKPESPINGRLESNVVEDNVEDKETIPSMNTTYVVSVDTSENKKGASLDNATVGNNVPPVPSASGENVEKKTCLVSKTKIARIAGKNIVGVKKGSVSSGSHRDHNLITSKASLQAGIVMKDVPIVEIGEHKREIAVSKTKLVHPESLINGVEEQVKPDIIANDKRNGGFSATNSATMKTAELDCSRASSSALCKSWNIVHDEHESPVDSLNKICLKLRSQELPPKKSIPFLNHAEDNSKIGEAVRSKGVESESEDLFLKLQPLKKKNKKLALKLRLKDRQSVGPRRTFGVPSALTGLDPAKVPKLVTSGSVAMDGSERTGVLSQNGTAKVIRLKRSYSDGTVISREGPGFGSRRNPDASLAVEAVQKRLDLVDVNVPAFVDANVPAFVDANVPAFVDANVPAFVDANVPGLDAIKAEPRERKQRNKCRPKSLQVKCDDSSRDRETEDRESLYERGASNFVSTTQGKLLIPPIEEDDKSKRAKKPVPSSSKPELSVMKARNMYARGKQLQVIVGISQIEPLMFRVKWCGIPRLQDILSSHLSLAYPQRVIEWYNERLVLTEYDNEVCTHVAGYRAMSRDEVAEKVARSK